VFCLQHMAGLSVASECWEDSIQHHQTVKLHHASVYSNTSNNDYNYTMIHKLTAFYDHRKKCHRPKNLYTCTKWNFLQNIFLIFFFIWKTNRM